MEGRLFFAQPTDYNWKRAGRTIKVVPVNALLVTLGKVIINFQLCSNNNWQFFLSLGINHSYNLFSQLKIIIPIATIC